MLQNSSPTSPSLRGLRILVVEDEMLISMVLEDLLGQYGCEVVGPAARIGKALELASTETIDAALLDLNVNGMEVYPVAKILADRGIPFAFVSGYGAGNVERIYRERPLLQKPFHETALAEMLRTMLSQASR